MSNNYLMRARTHLKLQSRAGQHASPHAQPSLHIVPAADDGHETLHGPVEPQWTRHVPWQVTSQLPVDVHVTTLWSPTVGAQSLTLVQV